MSIRETIKYMKILLQLVVAFLPVLINPPSADDRPAILHHVPLDMVLISARRTEQPGFMGIPYSDEPLPKTTPDYPEVPAWSYGVPNPNAWKIDKLCDSASQFVHDRQYDKAETALKQAILLNELVFNSGMYRYLNYELAAVFKQENRYPEAETAYATMSKRLGLWDSPQFRELLAQFLKISCTSFEMSARFCQNMTAVHAAYEEVKEEINAHPLLDGVVIGAVAATVAIAGKGKFSGLFPRAEALLGDTTAVGKTALVDGTTSLSETVSRAENASGLISKEVSSFAEARPESLELQEMYKIDQGVRMAPIDFDKMKAVDRIHQKRLAELLQGGKLSSGDDYYHAAMIMQHGATAEDTALAHILAINGALKGNVKARWLSAASMDRLLMRLQQPQIFGTQFTKAQGVWTMEPIKPNLIPDSIRKDFGVPTVAENEQRMLKMDEEISGPKK